ncbi:MAG: AAA family ATPase [Kiritimatiellales bacterium]|nr:AAA family ATPase [Kiritimatiellales bacterium]
MAYQPQEIFTPRSHEVNKEMYITRPELEKRFKSAVLGSKQIILHGESGTGKSWLYKKVFADQSIAYITVNMAKVASRGSIDAVISSVADSLTGPRAVSYKEGKDAKANAGFVNAGLSHVKDYVVPIQDNYLRLLNAFRWKIGSRKLGVVVFENIEAVVHNQEHLRQLCSLILLADDEEYARSHLGVLMVGTPSDLIELIARCDNSNTVKNRIVELPEVTVLSEIGVKHFIEKGFFKLLKYRLQESENFSQEQFIEEVRTSCDCVPQHLHELCLEIALCVEDAENIIDETRFVEGKLQWVRSNLLSELATVKINLNQRSTKIRRRDQVLYTLANIRKFSFTPKEVENVLRKLFPEATRGVRLNVPQILSDLANSDHPVIRQNQLNSAYRFVSPKLKIVIHAALKLGDGSVLVNDAVFGEVRG